MSSEAKELSHFDKQSKPGPCKYCFSNRIKSAKTYRPYDPNRYEHCDISNNVHLPTIIPVYKKIKWNETDHITDIISKAHL